MKNKVQRPFHNVVQWQIEILASLWWLRPFVLQGCSWLRKMWRHLVVHAGKSPYMHTTLNFLSEARLVFYTLTFKKKKSVSSDLYLTGVCGWENIGIINWLVCIRDWQMGRCHVTVPISFPVTTYRAVNWIRQKDWKTWIWSDLV